MRKIDATEGLIENEIIFVTRYKGQVVSKENPISRIIENENITINSGRVDRSLIVSDDNEDNFYEIDINIERGNPSSMGDLLQGAGLINSHDVDVIVRLQEEQGLHFGAAAMQLNLVSEANIQQALSQQFDYPYVTVLDDVVSQDVIAAYQPFSAQVEALRAVRSQLKLHWFNDQQKLLSITSPLRGEGRSYLCANLSVAFSQLGEKVLLIDANLRAPKQHDFFKLQQRQGLSDLLAGRVDESIIFRSPQFRDLSILSAGTVVPNPAELISRGLAQCLQYLRDQYDVILVDTPAFQSGTEAQMISVVCGGALMVARKDSTRLKDLESMQSDFENAGVRCLGAVINEF